MPLLDLVIALVGVVLVILGAVDLVHGVLVLGVILVVVGLVVLSYGGRSRLRL